MLAVPPPDISWAILLTLACVAGASTAVFWALVRRETTRRQWVTLRQWGKNHHMGFARKGAAAAEPALLNEIPHPRPRVRLWLTGADTDLLQLATPAPLRQSPATLGAGAPTWNILVRNIAAEWPATALRPAHRDSSFVDLYSLGSFPSMIAPDRFMLLGVDSSAARHMAQSPLKTLLPADIGLLLKGRRLLLDFSARPFDPIELDRMKSLAEQIVNFLPALVESKAS